MITKMTACGARSHGRKRRLTHAAADDGRQRQAPGESPGRSQLLRFPGGVRRDPAIDGWMRKHAGPLGVIAQRWFDVMRRTGEDVRELLHDGHPTACVGDAAFGYVNAFTAHVNVGFLRGAEIEDPKGMLEGTGRFMRHVKLRPGEDVDSAALTRLIETAYADMLRRLTAPSSGVRLGPVIREE